MKAKSPLNMGQNTVKRPIGVAGAHTKEINI